MEFPGRELAKSRRISRLESAWFYMNFYLQVAAQQETKESQCPVQHDANNNSDKENTDSNTTYVSECPMRQGEVSVSEIYFELIGYSMLLNENETFRHLTCGCGSQDNKDEVNPLNMMPPPNQRPQPDQPFSLDTSRVKSTIPKAGGKEGETWEYPSQQMFWNAMIRKVSSDLIA